MDGALRRWGRHLLGMLSGSPNADVFLELGWPDAQHLCTERLLPLFGRALAMPRGEHCPLPALIFKTALSIPGSWTSHCVDLCNSLGVLHPNVCGIGPLSLLPIVFKPGSRLTAIALLQLLPCSQFAKSMVRHLR